MADKPQKKRRGRRSFLNDFKADDSGQYSYMGNVHVYEGSVPYKTERQRVIVLTAMMCASAVAIGCIPAPSMLGYNNFYVVPFFIIELVAVFITAWAAIRLAAGGSELREYVYEKTVKAIPNRAPAAFTRRWPVCSQTSSTFASTALPKSRSLRPQRCCSTE